MAYAYPVQSAQFTATPEPRAMDASFLTERFTAFGFEFQNWMVIVAAALVSYGVYLSLKRDHGKR